MELRKLMAFGQSSFIISLPKAWVQKNRLKKGDVITVEERGAELTVGLQGKEERREQREMVIDCQAKSQHYLKTEIISAYVNNYDLIRVRYQTVEQRRHAKRVLQGLVGVEVVEESARGLVAKELLDMKEVSLVGLIRRIDNIVRSMLIEAESEGAKDSLYQMDEEINRLTLLTHRTVRAALENPRLLRLFETTQWACVTAREMARHLEHFADQIKRVVRASEDVDAKQREEMLALYRKVHAAYKTVMKAYYEKDTSPAFAFEEQARQMRRQCDRLTQSGNAASVKLGEHLKHMIVALSSIGREIMER